MRSSSAVRAVGALALAGLLTLSGCGGDAPVDRTPGDDVARTSQAKGIGTIQPRGGDPEQAATRPRKKRQRDRAEATARATRDFVGRGYAFDAPAGWLDFTARLRAVQPTIDLAAAETDVDDGFADNVSVLAQPYGGDPADFYQVAGRGLEKLVDDTRVVGQVTVAGATGLHVLSHLTMGRLRVASDQVYLVHDRTGVVLTLSTVSRSPAQRRALLAAVVDSWVWDPGLAG